MSLLETHWWSTRHKKSSGTLVYFHLTLYDIIFSLANPQSLRGWNFLFSYKRMQVTRGHISILVFHWDSIFIYTCCHGTMDSDACMIHWSLSLSTFCCLRHWPDRPSITISLRNICVSLHSVIFIWPMFVTRTLVTWSNIPHLFFFQRPMQEGCTLHVHSMWSWNDWLIVPNHLAS
jgi:hypothetical protein